MRRVVFLGAGLLSAVVLGAELTADGVYCLPGQQVAPEGLSQPGKMTGSVERCTLKGKCVFPKCMTIRVRSTTHF